jgi:hypothetical protein
MSRDQGLILDRNFDMRSFAKAARANVS